MSRAVRYEVRHRTRYHYPRDVRGCVLRLCLEPSATEGLRVLGFELDTSPAASLSPERDAFGNRRHVLNLHRRHRELTITSRFEVELDPSREPQGAGGWEEVRSQGRLPEFWHFLQPSAMAGPSPALRDFVARKGLCAGDDPLTSLSALSDSIQSSFDYQTGSTSAESPIDHLLQSGRGVCQDYAHVMIAIARSWGVPARYVSGYLHPTGRPGEREVASAGHAWVECHLAGAGWVGFDPTNGSFDGGRHIRVAAGRDYGDVSPTRGVFQGGAEAGIEVDVIVNAVEPLR